MDNYSNLKSWCKRAYAIGFTQTEIAEICGYSSHGIRKWIKAGAWLKGKPRKPSDKEKHAAKFREKWKDAKKPFPSPGTSDGNTIHGLRKGDKNGNMPKAPASANSIIATAKSEGMDELEALNRHEHTLNKDLARLDKLVAKLERELLNEGIDATITERVHTTKETTQGIKDDKETDLTTERTEIQRVQKLKLIVTLRGEITRMRRVAVDIPRIKDQIQFNRAKVTSDDHTGDKLDRLADLFGELAE